MIALGVRIIGIGLIITVSWTLGLFLGYMIGYDDGVEDSDC